MPVMYLVDIILLTIAAFQVLCHWVVVCATCIESNCIPQGRVVVEASRIFESSALNSWSGRRLPLKRLRSTAHLTQLTSFLYNIYDSQL